MQVVPATSIVSDRALGLMSFLFGFCLFLPMFVLIPIAPYLVDPVAAVPTATSIACTYCFLAFSTLIGPLIGLILFRRQMATGSRLATAIFWTGSGLLSPLYLLFLTTLFGGGGELLFNTICWHFGLFVGWGLLALLLRQIIARLWPFKIQDGSSCPQCGYCVRGVLSKVCPECGRAFNRDDLGLSEAAFHALLCGARTDMHAAAST